MSRVHAIKRYYEGVIASEVRMPIHRAIYRMYHSTFLTLILVAASLIRKMPRGSTILSDYFEIQTANITSIKLDETEYSFFTPNRLTEFRAKTLFTKEPETIEWISNFQKDSVFWDVGANVGTYSIFAGRKNLKVVAFEPSFLNLECLARNIILNNITTNVAVLPFALNRRSGIESLFMSSENFRAGGAHNSIELPIDQYGNEMSHSVVIQWPALTIDSSITLFNLPTPTHLKLDVDGCELQVLQGGVKALEQVESVLIEVYPFHKSAIAITNLLESSGLVLDASDFPDSANQIWVRK